MADKKNRKSKCIFISFFKENLENALKQGKNGIEIVKVVTFIKGCSEFNKFIHTQLYWGRQKDEVKGEEHDPQTCYE